MGYFSPVPIGTPADPNLERPIASAGPYFIAGYRPQQRLVLRRNPYYRGPRPRASAEIDYLLDTIQPGPRLVAAGRADYLADQLAGPAAATLIRRYGVAASVADPARHPVVVVNPSPTLYYFALNTSRRPFRNPLVRRAVAEAVDRTALTDTLGPGQAFPTDQYLPPAVPGYRGNGAIYPLAHPDVRSAVRLMRRAGVATPLQVTLLTGSDAGHGYATRTRILRRELRPLGIHLRVRAYPRDQEFVRDTAPKAAFDLADEGFVIPFLDPTGIEFPITVQARLRLPRALTAADGRAATASRTRAVGRVVAQLARSEVPLVAYAVGNTVNLVSGRVGCVLDQPVYGVDLARLCVGKP
jgi:ABC-type transport system substrate-binding protein